MTTLIRNKTWRDALQERRIAYMKDRYAACRDFSVPSKKYNDTTANGLTAAICDFIKYSGGDANRINTMGIYRSGKWTTSNTRRGTADIHAIIQGRAVSIEVKIGKDKISEHQVKEKERIERAGGIYFVATSMFQFYVWYVYTFENNKNQ